MAGPGAPLHVRSIGARPHAADRLGCSYVLPLAADRPLSGTELTGYLAWVAGRCELVVVDDSPPAVFAAHRAAWGGFCRHVRPRRRTLVGKVGNVMTGIELATCERVVIADDDVRYGAELAEVVRRLDHADVVRPQNYFEPLVWHAVWDSGRSLLNRVLDGDWPGTVALRRSTVLAAGGYAGDVMFENYELVRTVELVGGRQLVAPDVFVRRLPPTTRHFVHQRVRQAYDELARPARLLAFLPLLPAASWLGWRGRWRVLGAAALVCSLGVAGLAEVGRRRNGARSCFPPSCSLAAPLWVGERAVCVWLALGARVRGGVAYRGRRVRRAALSAAQRRHRIAVSGRGTP